ncbi:hypothetical protein VRRI112168_20325 [Vreelandella rituensis]
MTTGSLGHGIVRRMWFVVCDEGMVDGEALAIGTGTTTGASRWQAVRIHL